MSDDRPHIRDIERDEAWLSELATPLSDSEAIERVKYVVRAACQECQPVTLSTRSAITSAQIAVRRELATRHVPRRSMWRWIAPTLAAAAVVAFGVVRLTIDRPAASALDPTFNAFVAAMTRAPDDVDLNLIELEQDVDELGDEGFAMNHPDWESDWTNGMSESLDALNDEVSQSEHL